MMKIHLGKVEKYSSTVTITHSSYISVARSHFLFQTDDSSIH